MDNNNGLKYNTEAFSNRNNDSFNDFHMLYSAQTEIINIFQDLYLQRKKEFSQQDHFVTNNDLPNYTFNISKISSIKYWYAILWQLLITTNTEESYAKHKETRTALIILIKHYNFLFDLITTETKHDAASPATLKSNLQSIYKTISSASINFPLFKCLSFSIIQSKRKIESENKEIAELDKIHEHTLFNNKSLNSIWKSSVNLLISFNGSINDSNALKEKLDKNMKPKFNRLISLITKDRIPTMFLPYMITAFMLNYKTEVNMDKDYSILPSVLSFNRIHLNDRNFNVLIFMNKISDSIFTALTEVSHNTMLPPTTKSIPTNLIKQPISFDGITRLAPYLEFPVVNFDKINDTLCQLPDFNQKANIVCSCLNHVFTFWGYSNIELGKYSNDLSKDQINLITAISLLCSFTIYSTFNTNSEIPKKAYSCLDTVKKALSYETFSYDDFKEFFFVGTTRNINELLLYEQLRIPLKERSLDRLLMELYDIDFRESCSDIRNMVVEEFSTQDYSVKDTSYILLKTKFINKLVAKFKPNDCKRFLDNIEHFEQESFESFLIAFCKENNIAFPTFNTFGHPLDCESLKDAFLTDAFSSVLDLSIIELEHQFNLFWQYDFSIGYKEKKDIRPTYVLSGVNRTAINAFTKQNK